jgi:UDP-4-amino-4,6-dideoxy-N-acetyl-beta-L-altrosamine transaminase
MIPYGKHYIDEDDIQAVVDVLRDGMLTQGPMVERFERAIADYVGAKYAVAVSSGTAALHIGALAAGMGSGKTLITSPITFVASANAGLYCGGDVAFADVDRETVNMSPEALAIALKDNPTTQVVIPVHLAGLPCDMEAIKALADEAGAHVIEDAAHALGASYPNGSKVGCCANSLMTIFSFHPVKAIAAGEGGMVTTNDENVYRKLLRLRSHGINKLDDNFLLPEQSVTDGVINPWYYEMQELGYHYRITDIQCALGLSQMRHLDSFMSRRRLIAHNYDQALMDMPLVTPAQTVSKKLSGNHIYPVRIDFENLGKSRNRVMQELRGLGVNTQVHYMPVPMQPYYASFGYDLATINESMEYYKEALTLPMFYTLTDKEQEHVIYSLKTVLTA